ncbi:MAG: YhfC family glutamic-type intramembrane protease [Oscillospiraceae bacterium]|nr:YhfC family glutamic-type intramembrane protease [Oscillospiraceae bacterium]
MNVDALTVPVSSMICMVLAALFCIAAPILILLMWKKKYPDADIRHALIGAAGFFIFALVLEQLLHLVMLPLVMNSVVLYVIYGTLAAGVFEETARFITYKLILKKTTAKGNPADAITVGIGHGGFEAMVVVPMMMVSSFVLAVLMNTGNTAMLFEGMSEVEIALGEQQLQTVAANGVGYYMMACVERLMAMTVHICWSVCVFAAAAERKLWWLYPASILMHAFLDTPVALFQKNVLSMPVMYLCLLVPMAIAVGAAVVVYRQMAKRYQQ